MIKVNMKAQGTYSNHSPLKG